MTHNLVSAESAAVSADDADRYDHTSIMLHWMTVVLIVVQFVSIWAHEALGHQTSLAALLLSIHRTAGTLTLIVVAARLIWRRTFAYVPPLPTSMPPLQQLVAKATEISLYILLLAMPITGLGRVLLRGKPFELFIWHLPALLGPYPALRGLFAEAHEAGATVLAVLIILHVSAALFHQLVLRDGVAQRMLPRNVRPEKPLPHR
jgi:superoxide oxidase